MKCVCFLALCDFILAVFSDFMQAVIQIRLLECALQWAAHENSLEELQKNVIDVTGCKAQSLQKRHASVGLCIILIPLLCLSIPDCTTPLVAVLSLL